MAQYSNTSTDWIGPLQANTLTSGTITLDNSSVTWWHPYPYPADRVRQLELDVAELKGQVSALLQLMPKAAKPTRRKPTRRKPKGY